MFVDVLANVTVDGPGGEKKTRRNFVPKQMTLPELWETIDTEWSIWMTHFDLNQYQSDEMRQQRQRVRVHEVVLVEDFAEKAPVTAAREQQSDYFAQKQITLVPVILYVHLGSLLTGSKADGFLVTDDELQRLKEGFFKQAVLNGGGDVNPVITVSLAFLSDDPVQDFSFVSAYRKRTEEFLSANMKGMKPGSTVGGGA